MTGGSGSFFRRWDPPAFFGLLFLFDFARLYIYRADDSSFVVGFFVAPKAFLARRLFVNLTQAVGGAVLPA